MQMIGVRVLFWSLCLACDAAGHSVQPGAGEVEVVVSSTMGYGCVVPPFLVGGADDTSCNDRNAYILTSGARDPDPAEGPPGRYHLVGQWGESRWSYRAWVRARGEPSSEGAPADDVEFRVFVVSDWCVERSSVPKSYRKPSQLAPASAPWRTRMC